MKFPSLTIIFLVLFSSSLCISCSSESDFQNFTSSDEQITSQDNTIEIYEINYSDSIQAHRLEFINDSIENLCKTLYYNEPANHIQTQSEFGGDIITADVQGFYAGFKYGWSKGRTIFGKISTATACATLMSVASSLVAAFVSLGFEYLVDLVDHHKGMAALTSGLDHSYNTQLIGLYSNNIISLYPDIIQPNTTNEFHTAVLHNLILNDIEKQENTLESDSDITINSSSISPIGILTPDQIHFFIM